MPPRDRTDRFPLLDIHAAENRYKSARRRGVFAPARRLDERYRVLEPVGVTVRLWREDVSLTATGRSLWLFDREMRRAAAIVQQRPYRTFPRPASAARSGLEIAQARSGSIELLLEPFGLVRDFLLSDPVQMTVTALALLGGFRLLRVVRRTPKTSDGAPEAHERLEIEMPGRLRVSSPPKASIRIRLSDGSEVEIYPPDEA